MKTYDQIIYVVAVVYVLSMQFKPFRDTLL